jgi:ATP-dependent Clp protease ATP-binding subunit ClpC
VNDDAVPAIADAADRHLPGALPGKAVGLLDRCAVRARLKNWERPDDPAVVELDQQIAQLNQQKESAVADQQFDQAASFRDQADKLKKQRDRLLAERALPPVVVDVGTVEEVVRDLSA